MSSGFTNLGCAKRSHAYLVETGSVRNRPHTGRAIAVKFEAVRGHGLAENGSDV